MPSLAPNGMLSSKVAPAAYANMSLVSEIGAYTRIPSEMTAKTVDIIITVAVI